MHPAIAFTGLYGPSLASWLFANSDRLGDTFARLSRPIVAAVTDPTASLDRIGSVLVSQQSGQTEVIGLLHRNSDVLHDISTAVDAVQAGQDGIATSLDLLTSMSMVGLGISVLSQATLGIQFLALTRRLKKLATDVQKIKTILQAESRGRLQAGLKKLKNGLGAAADPDQANMYVNAAINTLIDSSANYTELLTSEIESGDRVSQWLLARHLTVSALGEAACHLHIGQSKAAILSLDDALIPLQAHAKSVFARTIDSDPARFLMPAMAEYGVTLESIAELYRQAEHAGAVESGQRLSASGRFEALRLNLCAIRFPRIFHTRAVRKLRDDWSEASAVVEEVNRMKGLKLAIGAYHSDERTYSDLVDEILQQLQSQSAKGGSCWAVFPKPCS